jgi:hypothetical protein
MVQPVMLGWLWQRWPSVLAVVACVALAASVGARRARPDARPPPVLDALPAISIRVVGELGACASDAGTCGQSPTFAPDGGSGNPALPGARVRVFAVQSDRHLLWAEVMTDAEGDASAAAPAGDYWLLVDAPGRVRRAERVSASASLTRVRIVLPSAEPVEIAVRSGSGSPIVGATVLVRADDELPHGALTGADGSARLEHVGRRIESVRVSASGYDSALVNPSSRQVLVTLSAPAALEIAVRDPAGQPAREAEVWISGIDFWPPRKVTALADGLARVEGLTRGTYDLRARLGSWVSAAAGGVTLERGQRERVTLELREGRFVEVRVAAGDEPAAPPVAGAEVTLVEGGLSPFPLSSRTGADGTVVLGPVPPGSAVINVRADGFMPDSVPLPKSAAPVSIALLRGGTLSGRVVDAEGRAIEGARLEVVGNDARGRPIARQYGMRDAPRGFFERSQAAPLPLVPMGELGVLAGPLPVPGMPPPAPAPSSAWVSDLDGNYRVDDVPPGQLRLVARHPDFVESLSEPVTLDPGGSRRVEIVLSAGATIAGRLLDELGRPVARARIDALSGQAAPASALTGFDGRFTFRAVPARVDLLVARPGEPKRFVLRRSIALAPGEARELELTLPGERASLGVLVRSDDGRALQGATVALLSLDPSVPLRQSVESDARGECSLLDAVGIPATLRIQAAGFRIFDTELDPVPARVEVRLSRGVAVVGRVTQQGGREGVRGAELTLLQAGERRSALSDSNGDYEIEGAALGPASLSVRHPKFSTGTWDVSIEPGEREGRAVPLPPLDLDEPGIASGTVLDARGQPVRGARVGVGLVPAFVPVGARLPGFVETDDGGRFELSGLEPGRVALSAYASGVGRGSLDDVTISSGERTTGLEIRLVATHAEAEPSAIANVAVTLGERQVGGEIEVVIVDVAAGSEAERAGVRQGDVLWSIDDEVVADMGDARALLGGSAGSDVILELERDGDTAFVRVRREAVR